MAAHVPTVVTEKDKQVLGLVTNRRVLEAEEVAKVFASRIYHVRVLR